MKDIKALWNSINTKSVLLHVVYKMIKHQHIKSTLGYDVWFDKVFSSVSPLNKNNPRLRNGAKRFGMLESYYGWCNMSPLRFFVKIIEEGKATTEAGKELQKLLTLYRSKYPELIFDLTNDAKAFEAIFTKRVEAGEI